MHNIVLRGTRTFASSQQNVAGPSRSEENVLTSEGRNEICRGASATCPKSKRHNVLRAQSVQRSRAAHKTLPLATAVREHKRGTCQRGSWTH
eukprot:216129-Pleurochrysis_carterae.AAC.1